MQFEHHEEEEEEEEDSIPSTRLEFLNQQQEEKLPLTNAWSTYFYKADKQRDWKQNVIYITSINYVEDFWSFYTHTYGLPELPNGSDYMFFKVMIDDREEKEFGFWSLVWLFANVSDCCCSCSIVCILEKKRWEDVSSRGGGKWTITIDPKRRKRDLDGYWLHLVRTNF